VLRYFYVTIEGEGEGKGGGEEDRLKKI